MPHFKSDGGQWNPVDIEAKAECHVRGVSFLGMKNRKTEGHTASIHNNWENKTPNHGVLPVSTFKKVAVDKFDGIKVAEPTPDQKKLLNKKEQ